MSRQELAMWGDTPMQELIRKCADHDVPHRTFWLAVADAVDELVEEDKL